MNIGVHISFQTTIFVFFRYAPTSGMLDSVVVLFLFFEKPPYCFPQWLYQLRLLPTVYKFLFSPRPHPNWSLLVFLMIAILTGVRWCIIIVLIWSGKPLTKIHVEHHVPVGHHYVFLENHLFRSSAHFSKGLTFWYWIVWGLCIFWGNKPLSDELCVLSRSVVSDSLQPHGL